jgi:predicted nucleic acid-binding protein
VIVVDCAAVVDALTVATNSAPLRERIAQEELHAPALLDYEVVSALRGLVRGGHLSEPRALEALADFEDLPVQRWQGTGGLRRRAFQLRHNLSAYDGAYVALAEALGYPLVTRDHRLARAAGHEVRVEVW